MAMFDGFSEEDFKKAIEANPEAWGKPLTSGLSNGSAAGNPGFSQSDTGGGMIWTEAGEATQADKDQFANWSNAQTGGNMTGDFQTQTLQEQYQRKIAENPDMKFSDSFMKVANGIDSYLGQSYQKSIGQDNRSPNGGLPEDKAVDLDFGVGMSTKKAQEQQIQQNAKTEADATTPAEAGQSNTGVQSFTANESVPVGQSNLNPTPNQGMLAQEGATELSQDFLADYYNKGAGKGMFETDAAANLAANTTVNSGVSNVTGGDVSNENWDTAMTELQALEQEALDHINYNRDNQDHGYRKDAMADGEYNKKALAILEKYGIPLRQDGAYLDLGPTLGNVTDRVVSGGAGGLGTYSRGTGIKATDALLANPLFKAMVSAVTAGVGGQALSVMAGSALNGGAGEGGMTSGNLIKLARDIANHENPNDHRDGDREPEGELTAPGYEDQTGPWVGNTPVNSRDGWHWEKDGKGSWKAVKDEVEVVEEEDNGGGGGSTTATNPMPDSPAPNPESGSSGGEDLEDDWVLSDPDQDEDEIFGEDFEPPPEIGEDTDTELGPDDPAWWQDILAGVVPDKHGNGGMKADDPFEDTTDDDSTGIENDVEDEVTGNDPDGTTGTDGPTGDSPDGDSPDDTGENPNTGTGTTGSGGNGPGTGPGNGPGEGGGEGGGEVGKSFASGGGGTEAEWSELFPYTKITPLQKKKLLPMVKYIKQARGMV